MALGTPSRKHPKRAFVTNVALMKKFLGNLILMGLMRGLSASDLWSEKFSVVNQLTISKAMSRDQFQEHMRYLHLPFDPTR